MPEKLSVSMNVVPLMFFVVKCCDFLGGPCLLIWIDFASSASCEFFLLELFVLDLLSDL